MANKISEAALNRMALHGGKVTRAPKKAEAPPPPRPPQAPPQSLAPPLPPPAPDNSAQLSRVIEQNTRAIEGLTAAQNRPPPERKPWRIKLVRSRDKLIDFADIVPMEMKR